MASELLADSPLTAGEPSRRAPGFPARFLRADFSYTRENHETFRAKGFLALPDILQPRALRYLQQEFDKVMRSRRPEVVHAEWVMSPHQLLPQNNNWVWALATEPELLRLVRAHLGEDVVLFSSQLTDKPPGGGTFVPWHQDGERCRTLWINLDDVDSGNGTLRLKPGWYHRGRAKFRKIATTEELDRASFYLRHHLFEMDPGIGVRRFEHDVEELVLPAGSLEVHHPYTPHSSLPNASQDRHRRAIILRYQPLSEPLVGGPIYHWATGKQYTKVNYLMPPTAPCDHDK